MPPYKDPDVRREYTRRYQQHWHRHRKQMWLEGARCVVCGSSQQLVIGARGAVSLRELTNGINPWSLSQERFEALMREHGCVRCLSCQHRHVYSVRHH